jgi:hypothetical protein
MNTSQLAALIKAPPRGRLTWRIQSLFVFFAVALLIIVGFLLIYLSFVAQRNAIARTQTEIAQRAALDVSASLSTIEQSLIVQAHTHGLADLNQDDQRRVLTRLVATLSTRRIDLSRCARTRARQGLALSYVYDRRIGRAVRDRRISSGDARHTLFEQC